MKNYLKIFLLLFISLVLFILVFIVDVTFYRVPMFIKIYGIEREIIVGLAIFCLYQSIKWIFLRTRMTTKCNLVILGSGIFALAACVFLPQFCFRKYLVLWDENPFLAEFPFVWSLASILCTFLFLAVTLFILMSIRELEHRQRNTFNRMGFQILTVAIVGFSAIYNLFDSRYSFKPLVLFTQEMTYYLWLLFIVVGGISVAVSWQRSWLDLLNRKEKYTTFFISLVLFPILTIFCCSRIILPVFAFSTTVKGFALSSLMFIWIYSGFSFVGLLFRLPTAAFFDRMNRQISSFEKMGQLLDYQSQPQRVFELIVQYAMESTQSEAAWYEEICEGRRVKMTACLGIPESIRHTLENEGTDGWRRWILSHRSSLIIPDIAKDDLTGVNVSDGFPWRVVMAVPHFRKEALCGIVYVVKTSREGHGNEDEQYINSFLNQATFVLESRNQIPLEVTIPPESSPAIFRIFPEEIPSIDGFKFSATNISRITDNPGYWHLSEESDGPIALIQFNGLQRFTSDVVRLAEFKGSLNALLRVEKSPSEIITKSEQMTNLGTDGVKTLAKLAVCLMQKKTGALVVAGSNGYTVLHYRPVANSVRYFELAGRMEEMRIQLDHSDLFVLLNVCLSRDDITKYSNVFIDRAEFNEIQKRLSEVIKMNFPDDSVTMILIQRN